MVVIESDWQIPKLVSKYRELYHTNSRLYTLRDWLSTAKTTTYLTDVSIYGIGKFLTWIDVSVAIGRVTAGLAIAVAS